MNNIKNLEEILFMIENINIDIILETIGGRVLLLDKSSEKLNLYISKIQELSKDNMVTFISEVITNINIIHEHDGSAVIFKSPFPGSRGLDGCFIVNKKNILHFAISETKSGDKNYGNNGAPETSKKLNESLDDLNDKFYKKSKLYLSENRIEDKNNIMNILDSERNLLFTASALSKYQNKNLVSSLLLKEVMRFISKNQLENAIGSTMSVGNQFNIKKYPFTNSYYNIMNITSFAEVEYIKDKIIERIKNYARRPI